MINKIDLRKAISSIAISNAKRNTIYKAFSDLDSITKEEFDLVKSDISKVVESMLTKDTVGKANGVASLDSNGSVPIEQLGNIDITLFLIVRELPTDDIKSNKIYLVPNQNGKGDNVYVEYLYVEGVWEKVGEFKPEVDLSHIEAKLETKANITDVNNRFDDLSNHCFKLGYTGGISAPFSLIHRFGQKIQLLNNDEVYTYGDISSVLEEDTEYYIYDKTINSFIKTTKIEYFNCDPQGDFFKTIEPLDLTHTFYLDNEKTGIVDNLNQLTIEESNIFVNLPYVEVNDNLDDDIVPQYIYDATDNKWIEVIDTYYVEGCYAFNTEKPLDLTHELYYSYSSALVNWTTVGDFAIALGDNSSANGDNSTSLGNNTSANALGSIAIGNSTNSEGECSIAIGNNTSAKGDSSITLGKEASTDTQASESIAIGANTSVIGSNSLALGSSISINSSSAIAIGYITEAYNNSIAIGTHNAARNMSSIVIGDYAETGNKNIELDGKYSIAIGCNSKAKSNYSLALGAFSTTSIDYAIALGKNVSNTKSIFGVGFNGVNGIDMDRDNYGLYLKDFGGYDGTNLVVKSGDIETLNPDIKSVQQIINEKADASAIPTKVSQLTNDANFITSYTETDPVWTREKTNYYTKTEIDNKGYLTAHQSLDNYAKKTEIPNVSTKADLVGDKLKAEQLPKLLNITTAATAEEVVTKFNALLADLKAKGYMEADTAE